MDSQGCKDSSTKTLIGLRGFAGLFESSLGAHVRRYVFSRCDSNVFGGWSDKKDSDVMYETLKAKFTLQHHTGPEVIKLFMLNSAEHEIGPANKSQIDNNLKLFLAKHS